VTVTYLIHSICMEIAQGERVSSLTLLSKGEKKFGKQCGKDATVVCSAGRVAVLTESAECSSLGSRLPLMPKGEIVGIFTDRRKHVCH
jgi:hypothetical protein